MYASVFCGIRLSLGKVPSIFLIKFMFRLRRQDGFMIILRRGETGKMSREMCTWENGGWGFFGPWCYNPLESAANI